MPWPRRAVSRPATPHAVVGLGAGLELLVALAHRRDLGAVREARAGTGSTPCLAQALELGPPLGEQVGLLGFPGPGLVGHRRNPSRREYQAGTLRPLEASIFVTLSFFLGPRGVSTVTISFFFAPIRALPIGDSFESFSLPSASAAPTSRNFCDLPPDFCSLTWTIAPTPTVSVSMCFSSITVERRSLSWSCAIRCSSIACSFLASSYSAFSVMSPNSRASLIRSATSRRLSVSRCSSSPLSFSSPSSVISVSRNAYLFLVPQRGLSLRPVRENPCYLAEK